ncbi:MAG: glycerol-3-phosphate 1-O-acyltransferase PlsY [Candidatus Velthaea sp.]
MIVVAAALAVAAAFFIGAIPFGVIVGRLFYRTDVRKAGSGNIGAANALRTLGRRGAIAVLLLDALKGALPTLLVERFGGGMALASAVAFAAVMGHCYSPFLGGKGGKGVATSYGAVWALSWPAGVTFTFVWIVALLASGFASVASMAASVAMPFALWFTIGFPGLGYGLASALFIIYAHRENIARLAAGTESVLPIFSKRSGSASR